ncbi:methionyl-tRNA formyltransferase [candidate division GN15 bacterium]|nr:methionyl-tRNA formyltransferase [candidate division GN15 bacterium]
MSYVIATSRSWHQPMADRLRERTGQDFHLITRKADLTPEKLEQLAPEFVFFPHWSYIIPDEIIDRFVCVIFHMTDLPYGRGGSPLQNLIARGMDQTQLSAIKCVSELDAGPIYMKRQLCLHGSAEEIYLRAGKLTEDMIVEIVTTRPEPQPQSGEVTAFKRRTPEQSRIEGISGLDALFDHIRMLDAKGYPHAYLEADGFRFEFRRAARRDGRIVADVVIREADSE